MTDPISEMLTSIRNALSAKKQEVLLPYSKFRYSLAKLLFKEGWLAKVEVLGEERSGKTKRLLLQLKYDSLGMPAILGCERISKPGQRIYTPASQIHRFRMGSKAVIISTSKGLMTDKEARREKIGGEVICKIW